MIKEWKFRKCHFFVCLFIYFVLSFSPVPVFFHLRLCTLYVQFQELFFVPLNCFTSINLTFLKHTLTFSSLSYFSCFLFLCFFTEIPSLFIFPFCNVVFTVWPLPANFRQSEETIWSASLTMKAGLVSGANSKLNRKKEHIKIM